MVVGIYGIAYAYTAWKPEQGDLLIWIGLLGKVLGPLGWIKTVWDGELPPRTFPLILFNDLIWWFPFLLYLFRNHRHRAKILTAILVFLHIVACLGLLLIRGGTEVSPSLADRQRWILGSVPLWTTVWLVWVLSSLSLIMFFSLWGRKLKNRWAWLIGVAVAFDLAGEFHYIVLVTDPGRTLPQFSDAVSRYSLLSAAVANGLYCVLGFAFSVISWKQSFLKGAAGLLGLAVWVSGFALTATVLLQNRLGTVVTGAAVMTLFIPWAAVVGSRLDTPNPDQKA
jgi:hypothetical protein